MWNGDFELPVQNRFEVLSAQESRSECGNNNTTVTRQTFASSNLDDKLLCLFDELRFMRNEQVICGRNMQQMHCAMYEMNDKMGQVTETTNAQTEFLKTLAYKSVDMEARSRRNNVIFRGLSENYGENCVQIITDFLQNHLDFDPHHIYIARAHRLGPKRQDQGRRFHNRPLIANFRDFDIVETIMNRARRLRGTSFSVDHDYPREIKEARTRLWPLYKDLKHQSPRSKVQLLYPAKLIQDGRMVRDELPDWGKYMGINRLVQVHQIENVKPQYVRRPSDPAVSTPPVNHTAPQQPADHHSELPFTPTVYRSGAQKVASSEQATVLRQESTHIASQPMEQNNPIPSGDKVTAVSTNMATDSTTTPLSKQPANPITLTPSQIAEMEVVIPPTILEAVPSSVSPSVSESTPNLNMCGQASGVLPVNNDETSVKAIQSDETNPLLPSDLGTRGRNRAVKSAARSERRSQSAVPYKRQSTSRSGSRAATNRVLPGAKNSTNTPQVNRALPVDITDSSQGTNHNAPTSTGQPPTHSETVTN